jgi:hypothetical protein
MSTSLIAAWYVAVMLLVCGLSHALHAKLWVELFSDLVARRYAAFYIGMPTLASGLVIALAHPQWTWSPAVIATLVGGAWIVKGAIYLLAPPTLQRVAMPNVRRPAHFRWAGLLMAAVGLVLGVHLWTA